MVSRFSSNPVLTGKRERDSYVFPEIRHELTKSPTESAIIETIFVNLLS